MKLAYSCPEQTSGSQGAVFNLSAPRCPALSLLQPVKSPHSTASNTCSTAKEAGFYPGTGRTPLARSIRTARSLACLTASGTQSDARLAAWEGEHKEGDILGDRYTVLQVLGRGNTGITYKAVGPDKKEVAVKALSLRASRAWKQVELFEREARALQGLQHPGIPKYIEYFQADTPEDREFYLVQELARGRSRADLVQGGWSASEEEVTCIARQLLQLLQYLSSRSPPIVHRQGHQAQQPGHG